jgi:hypothetical protein
MIIVKPVMANYFAESEACPCVIYGRHSGNGTALSLSTSLFTSHYHSTNAPHHITYFPAAQNSSATNCVDNPPTITYNSAMTYHVGLMHHWLQEEIYISQKSPWSFWTQNSCENLMQTTLFQIHHTKELKCYQYTFFCIIIKHYGSAYNFIHLSNK